MGRAHTLFYTSPHTSSHPPHSPNTSFHTLPHLPHTSPHYLTLPHTSPLTHLTPPLYFPTLISPLSLTLPHTSPPHSRDTFPQIPPHTSPNTSPHFLTIPTPPPTLPHTSLSFTPYQNYSLFSFIAKLVQQPSARKTLYKFHKKTLNTKMATQHLSSDFRSRH